MSQIQTPATTPPDPGHADITGTFTPAPQPATPLPPAAPAPAAPSQTGSLSSDPAFNAFMARIGLSNADLANAAQNKVDAINQSVTARMPGMQRAEDQRLGAIQERMDSRGFANSSDAIHGYGNENAAFNDRMSALHNAAAVQTANVYNNLVLSLARNLQGQGNQGDASASNLTVANAGTAPNPYLTPAP